MRKIALSLAVLGTGLVPLLCTAPAHAQATRTWVSGVGDDANPCSRTAPCKTFAGAISKTAAFGEVNCVDPGGFGGVTITKSITYKCEYTEAGVLVSGTNAIIVNLPLSTDRVTLEGLDIEGLGTSLDGIRFIQNGILHVRKSTIRGFRGTNGNGINFIPTGGGSLAVGDTYITDNGQGTGGGIRIQPSGTGSANVSINRVALENNNFGLLADGTNSTGGVNVVVANAVVHGNSGNGIAALSNAGHAPVQVLIDRSDLSANGNVAASANGSQASGLGSATMRIGGTTIAHNVTGVSVVNAGVLQSFKNNQIAGNTTDGTPMNPFPGPGGQPLQ